MEVNARRVVPAIIGNELVSIGVYMRLFSRYIRVQISTAEATESLLHLTTAHGFLSSTTHTLCADII